MSKNLILYFSRDGENYIDGTIVPIDKGNTEIIAEFLQDALDADLYQIETVDPYPFNYKECVERAKEELTNDSRPELKEPLETIEDIDNLFICSPCWCGTYPKPVITQLDKLDLTNKNIYPIMTHEGSGFGYSQKDLEKAAPNATIHKGLCIQGKEAKKSQPRIQKWVQSLDIKN